MDRERFSRIFLLLLILITGLFIAMVRRFLGVLLLAALVAGFSHPLYARFLRLFRGRKALASGLSVFLLLVIVAVPLTVLLGLVAAQALAISEKVGPWVSARLAEPGLLIRGLPGIDRLAPYEKQILAKAGEAVGSVGSLLFGSLSAATRGTVSFFFNLFLLLYSVFFFLMDGGVMLRKALAHIPLSESDKSRMVGRFLSVTRATVKGTLVIGLVQGTLAGIAFAIAGIPSSLFWGTLMVFLSTIPGVGTAIVWLPAGIVLLARGATGEGVFLLLFCALVVGSVDNLIRPRLVGADTKLHPLLILFSTIGGLLLFGVLGFLIGPILGALFVTVWDIYAHTFREYLTEEEGNPPSGP
jgi:predicted PurR-regulated permease PerM